MAKVKVAKESEVAISIMKGVTINNKVVLVANVNDKFCGWMGSAHTRAVTYDRGS